MGKVATSPLPPRGSPPLQSGGQNQKLPINGQGGYITPAASGIPSASKRGAKSEVAHKWARCYVTPAASRDPLRFRAGVQNQKWPINGQGGYVTPPASGIPSASVPGANSEVAHKWARWLHHPCRLGDPRGFRAGCKIRSGPFMGKVATSPPASGIPEASKPGAKSEVAHKWARCLITPAASGIPSASERGAKSEVAHKWARWLRHPSRL